MTENTPVLHLGNNLALELSADVNIASLESAIMEAYRNGGGWVRNVPLRNGHKLTIAIPRGLGIAIEPPPGLTIEP